MPHLSIGVRAEPGSNSPAKSPQKAAPPSPQFIESQQLGPPQGPSQPEYGPGPPNHLSSGAPSPTELSPGELSPEELSLDATEPFPPGLFRVPVPNAVFDRIPELTDSALQCLLGLIHLSFRFDPAESSWVCPNRQFSRSEIENVSGLSDQGARNGLSELESLGWARADRSGRSHRHQLLLKVPDRRFTYVPTALLEQASDVGSGTELRVVLAVLRRTWGWTRHRKDPQSGEQSVVHDRWAQLSNRELASATGRSETVVGQAAEALQGEWIERVRPGSGAYQYRFLPKRVGDHTEETSSFSTDGANNLPPDRQNSGPPSFSRKNLPRDRQKGHGENTVDPLGGKSSSNKTNVVLVDNSPRQTAISEEMGQTLISGSKAPPPDFSSLPPEKRDLAEKLSNVGIWAGRIAEVLSRFSTQRIQANFQLYRRRSAEQTIRKPGAWLYKAIAEGYALPDSKLDEPERRASTATGTLPPLEHKDTLSEAKKDAYVVQGIGEEHFHRCPSGRGGPNKLRFMYFDPDVGGPTPRV